ncbi:MipA/OmpV family protein [Sphingopyxis yananensis]|uniref:MipA/OmpV family protein n=1 Tax=Sphingopyxis yananensis TaxID=2886687 RepID=UPI001D11BCF4|nr:MipA/OmpV family protein [Sphingopyxis yananensis]MCC2601760.1 MipA/OmpV family protein [Sphingopyxis yananensis]
MMMLSPFALPHILVRPIPAFLGLPSSCWAGTAIALAGLVLAPAAVAQQRYGPPPESTPEPVAAQSPADIDKISDAETGRKASRTRVFLGPQFGPAFPSADRGRIGPFVDYSRARGGEFFPFEAPDESFGFNIYEKKGTAFGLAANLQGRRKASDTDGFLPSVKRSVELGVGAQTWMTPDIRLRAEARKAISGHQAWVGNISADYVRQHGDDWLWSIGPRITLADGKFHRTYYGVRAVDAAPASPLSPYRPKGGVHSLGLAASAQVQLTEQWGLAGYAKYERLVGDAASSPVTREYGSRNQPSIGLAVSYSFNSIRQR